MKPSGILDAAATTVERNGWVQAEWWRSVIGADGVPLPSEDCPVCAGGAINIAGDFVPDYDEHIDGPTLAALEAFADHLRSLDDSVSDWRAFGALDAIATWNDANGRTVGEVVAALRAVAQSEREAGR